MPEPRTGGQILVDQLHAQGVDAVFCVPGESYLGALDALHDSAIRVVTCRHEAGAASMAETYGKLTGRPGVCFVTRGPGATQASVGVHVATQDSTPMVLFVGQVPRATLGREAFQEVDYPQLFGGIAKAAEQVQEPGGLSEAVARAFLTAASGRPGPVVLAIPEDVLEETASVADTEPFEVDRPGPGPDQLAALRDLLEAAERPLLLVGEGGWTAAAGRDIRAFCEANNLPVASAFACRDYVDNRSPAYVGHILPGIPPALRERVEQADLLVAVGGRLDEVTTFGYTLVEVPRPRQTLVHVHPSQEELSRNYERDLAIVADLSAFARAARSIELSPSPRRRQWAEELRGLYGASLEPKRLSTTELDMGDAIAWLRERLPDDAVLAYGAGSFTLWPHLFYEFSQFGTQLVPQAGSMGWGLPAALAAKVLDPERLVVCIAGDGDFMMSAPELATAAQYELPVVVLVVNNGSYGTIRAHQEAHYPGRVVGTDLVNPDFAELARACGGHGETVTRTSDLAEAFERCVAAGVFAVVDMRVDPAVLTPTETIADLRAESSPTSREETAA